MPEGQSQEGETPAPLQQRPLPAAQSPIETEGPRQTAGQVLEGTAGRGFPARPGGPKETLPSSFQLQAQVVTGIFYAPLSLPLSDITPQI